MLSTRIDRFKEEWFLVLGKLAAVSTPQLGIIYGFANRHEAREPVSQAVPPAGQLAHRPRLIA
ncbi:hypothetical protein [Mycobacterium sp. E1747]|uniref:hypothetical protein n=1 Tax=Mycobacterium sp. E1747 TaxID=1834128 RepID=UPI000801A935|nr:hypothetical protein [Mycobacterium sp. E1747]OBH13286.1 hypothetical protein A5695_14175 [Mycobacterium sp. E1747]